MVGGISAPEGKRRVLGDLNIKFDLAKRLSAAFAPVTRFYIS